LIHWLGDALLAVMFSAFFVILVWQLLYSEEKSE